jgi:hypothetical protein
MTVFRPIAGVAKAIAAGLATNFFGVPRLRHAGTRLLPPGAEDSSPNQAIIAEIYDDGHASRKIEPRDDPRGNHEIGR